MFFIVRKCSRSNVEIDVDGSESTPFEMAPYTMGGAHMPAAWTTANLGFLVSSEQGGTYQLLYTADGVLAQITGPAAGKSYTFPKEVAAWQWVKFLSHDGAGVPVVQTEKRIISVDLKG